MLSMLALSYGVVQVDDSEEAASGTSLTSITLQDVGQVLPGTLVSVVKLPSSSEHHQNQQQQQQQLQLCRSDEIGELCLSSRSTASGYYGLAGLTGTTFKLVPHGADHLPIGRHEFVRSGLLGFLGPGGLVFVCGAREHLIEQVRTTGRRHSTNDLVATVLAVEPVKFIYRGRFVYFYHCAHIQLEKRKKKMIILQLNLNVLGLQVFNTTPFSLVMMFPC